MIPSAYITEWRQHAPWIESSQVEQDLILSKALVQIFSDPHLKKTFAFRGGTSLQKIFFPIPTRYSEDIDLVQVPKESIGTSIDALRAILDPWLGEPKRERTEGRVVLKYKFESEEAPVRSMKLKIEINNGEHFTVFGYKTVPYQMQSTYFSGQTDILTFEIEEILGTKLRALYQRKKGRDLYDMGMAYQYIQDLNDKKLVECFLKYMEHEGNSVSQAQYEANLDDKLKHKSFSEDVQPLLRAGSPKFDAVATATLFKKRTLPLLP